jgi:hypothetical protein
MIEAVISSETSTNSFRTSWRLTSEDSPLRNHYCGNFRSEVERLHYEDEPVMMNIVACMSDVRRGFGLDIVFIDYLQDVTTNNLTLSLFTHFTNHTVSFSACGVSTRRFLVTASNNDYSSASGLKSCLNGVSLST